MSKKLSNKTSKCQSINHQLMPKSSQDMETRRHRLTDSRTHGLTDSRTHGHTDSRTHGLTDSRTEKFDVKKLSNKTSKCQNVNPSITNLCRNLAKTRRHGDTETSQLVLQIEGS